MIELVFIDGPNDTGRPDFAPFVKRGFKGPYKKWCDFNNYDVFTNAYRETLWDIPITEETYVGVFDSAIYLTNYLNNATEPFDGFAGFS